MGGDSFQRSDVERRVKEILSDQLNFPSSNISGESSLVKDLSMDSFSAIEIVFAIESEFGIKVEQDEIVQFQTVKDIVERVMRSS